MPPLPGRCECPRRAVNAARKCRFFSTRVSRCHTYYGTQKCLLSAMVCVAQKALVFLCKRPPTWDPILEIELSPYRNLGLLLDPDFTLVLETSYLIQKKTKTKAV